MQPDFQRRRGAASPAGVPTRVGQSLDSWDPVPDVLTLAQNLEENQDPCRNTQWQLGATTGTDR